MADKPRAPPMGPDKRPKKAQPNPPQVTAPKPTMYKSGGIPKSPQGRYQPQSHVPRQPPDGLRQPPDGPRQPPILPQEQAQAHPRASATGGHEESMNLPFGSRPNSQAMESPRPSSVTNVGDWNSGRESASLSEGFAPYRPRNLTGFSSGRRSQSFDDLTELVKHELCLAHILDEKLLHQTHRGNSDGSRRSREVSSGLGGEAMSDTDVEIMDNLCRNIVAKVMQRTSQPQASRDMKHASEIEQFKFDLRSERTKVHEMQSSIKTERTKSLEWMEKHNRERDSRQLLQAEMAELKQDMMSLEKIMEREKEERIQLKSLYEAERSQAEVLDDALQMERDHFRKLKQTLELERSRAKAASDRDADTIIELRTNLEVEHEKSTAFNPSHPPSCSPFMQRHNKAPMFAPAGSLEDSQSFQLFILKLQHELKDERDRVDALKCCLEQERDRSEMLMLAANAGGVSSNKRASVLANIEGSGGGFDQDWVTFHQRRLDEAEMEKAEIFRELQKQRQLNGRLSQELDQLRAQMGSSASPNAKGHERMYIRDLESKLDAYRQREVELLEEMGRVRMLIQGLQSENSMLHEREKQFIMAEQSREGEDEQEQMSDRESTEMIQQKMDRIMGENEALQNSVTLLENRLGRLKDELELQDIPPQMPHSSRVHPGIILELETTLEQAEEFRQSLIWQKSFLLLLLVAQTQDKQLLAGSSKPKKIATKKLAAYFANFPRLDHKTPKIRFRIAARTVQSQIRLQILARLRREKMRLVMIQEEDFEFKESPKPRLKPLLTTDI